jgi:thiol-disulfide isomerase/thioredoxin
MIIFLTTITRLEAKTGAAPEALVALAEKLASLRSISYKHHCERSYPDNKYLYQMKSSFYVEFDQTDKRSLTRFRVENDEQIMMYNGTELIDLNKKAKTYRLSAKPNPDKFGRYTLFVNSIQELYNELPKLIAGDSIPMYQQDSIIDNKLYKVVQLNMRRWLQYRGNPLRLDSGVVFYYRIVIDPATWLPYQVIHTSNTSITSVNRTTFTDINIHPEAPADSSWYYTTYAGEYQPEKKEKRTPLIAAGAMMMPQWSLPEYNGKDDPVFKSSHLKGRLVLLDFWIKNCGPCMKSFPVLQRLQKTYGGHRFQLVSINAWDKKEQIDFFYKREKPLYKMLYNGEAMAKALGIDGYPVVILIDKTGKVIYSGEFNYAKVEELIRANL